MITIVNKDNAGLYSSYYEEVSNLLRQYNAAGERIQPGDEATALIPMEEVTFATAEDYTPGLYYVKDENGYVISNDSYDSEKTYYKSENITSLDEVFAYIADIANIDKRYTRLPLDEPAFEIDLDKRTINVPNSFRTNGVAVQGDVIAETLYFVCPRFFDATDLGNSDKDAVDESGNPKAAYSIFIEWENAAGEKGISRPWIHDIVSMPGKLIFGWPLCEKVTKKAGNVKFAVRFYKYSNGKTSYSLSTQAASITIKPSLGIDMDGEYIYCDDADDILNRFENSPLASGVSTKADVPKLRNNLPLFYNLSDGDEQTIQGYNEDGGQISYRWTKVALAPRIETENDMAPTEAQLKALYPLQYMEDDCPGKNDIRPGGKSLPLTYKIDYMETEDTTRQPNKVYYINTGTEEKPAYTTVPSTEEDLSAYLTTVGKDAIYEKFSTAIIDGVGVYQAAVSNRQRTSVETTKTKEMVVEYPIKPVISTAVGFKCEEDENGKVVAVAGASASTGDTLSVVVNSNAMNQSGNIRGIIGYQWYKAQIDSETIDSGDMVFEVLEDETSSVLVPEEEGFYRLLVTNSLNGEKDSFTTGAVRVMNAPSTPVIEYSEEDENQQDDLMIDKYPGENLKIAGVSIQENVGLISEESSDELKETYGIDEVLYQWYKYRGTSASLSEDAAAAKEGTFKIESDSGIKGEAVEGGNGPVLSTVGLETKPYFCIVTNKINGMETSVSSRFFTIVNVDSE